MVPDHTVQRYLTNLAPLDSANVRFRLNGNLLEVNSLLDNESATIHSTRDGTWTYDNFCLLVQDKQC